MNSFTKNLFKIFWIFFLGSIIGYVYETLICIPQVGLTSRQGLLIGPFIPVYGVGAVVYYYIFRNIKRLPLVFILSIFVGAIVEYLFSLFQEIIFGTVSWDYSEYFLNFDGRTSVFHAIFWGVAGVIFVKYIYKILKEFLEYILNEKYMYISIILVVFMSINIMLTCITSYRQKERVEGKARTNYLSSIIDKYFTDEKLDKKYENRIRKTSNGI